MSKVQESEVFEVDFNALVELAEEAKSNRHRAFSVWRKLTKALVEVIWKERDAETVFNNIPLRDCLPQHTIMATTWHIDDIRPYFSNKATDEELYETLRSLERLLADAAVSAGYEVIENELNEKFAMR